MWCSFFFFFGCQCVFFFYRVVTRVQRYATSDIFASNPRDPMVERYLVDGVGGRLEMLSGKRSTFFFRSVPHSFGECEAEYHMNLTAFFAFQSGKKYTAFEQVARPTWLGTRRTVSLTNVCLFPTTKNQKAFNVCFTNEKFARIHANFTPGPYHFTFG